MITGNECLREGRDKGERVSLLLKEERDKAWTLIEAYNKSKQDKREQVCV